MPGVHGRYGLSVVVTKSPGSRVTAYGAPATYAAGMVAADDGDGETDELVALVAGVVAGVGAPDGELVTVAARLVDDGLEVAGGRAVGAEVQPTTSRAVSATVTVRDAFMAALRCDPRPATMSPTGRRVVARSGQ